MVGTSFWRYSNGPGQGGFLLSWSLHHNLGWGSQEINMKINRIILDIRKSYKEIKVCQDSVVGSNLDWLVMGQSPCFWPGQPDE